MEKISKHARSRLSQRGIRQEVAEIVYQFGRPQGDKLTLDSKSAKGLILELEKEICALKKVVDQKGVTLVVGEDGKIITAYRFEGRAA